MGEIQDAASSTPDIVEDVLIEEVSIDGMCGVY
ncbi:MAG: mycofactocin precursor [Defluviicoccus sp.]|nr:MAG: mycofactocin precursor [Defluviicoccus sp.]